MIRSGLPIASRTGRTRASAAAIAADHDRERAVDGADLAAAHRRIEHRRAPLAGLSGKTTRRVRRDRAHVDDDAVRLERAEDAGLSFEDLRDVGSVRQHRDDGPRLAGDVGGR